MDPTSFYFIPLLPSFVKHSSNHRVQQTSFERSLGTREGLVEDFRAVYAIVQFSWIILFGKFQRNLFQRGKGVPVPVFLCSPRFYGFCSYFIKRTNSLSRKRNTKYSYEYFVSLRFDAIPGFFERRGARYFKFKSSP